ncbi:ETS-related transcription factor Elf-1-like [Ostrea edulis]|uniref:ETS-related transcription factor Elf-1-like n=1 Tax=Ostrea edulis TaxID=37623 RepID=UPI0024AFA4AB|nr:ETS-related transcription factor Elf-1-like [Ostrea edulis]
MTSMNDPTPDFSQILKYLHDPNTEFSEVSACLPYKEDPQSHALRFEQEDRSIPSEYTTLSNTTYDPAYLPDHGSDGSELEDDASVMLDYTFTECPSCGHIFCPNCACYQTCCSCYNFANIHLTHDHAGSPVAEEDSNDSIERKLPSIDIFRDFNSPTGSLNTPNETGKRKRGAKNILLWKFLLAELSTPNAGYIKWVNKHEGTFRFMDTVEVSRRWGQKKQKTDMNFEKLSRGIRHYYKNKFMTRIDGVRLVYKFNWSKIPKEWQPFDVIGL